MYTSKQSTSCSKCNTPSVVESDGDKKKSGKKSKEDSSGGNEVDNEPVEDRKELEQKKKDKDKDKDNEKKKRLDTKNNNTNNNNEVRELKEEVNRQITNKSKLRVISGVYCSHIDATRQHNDCYFQARTTD
ncbi:hypothetical protein RFI_31514 [Reticulomyxa filosa]|uniref:Uncharacterized protein n=1 Tax=Reticulomyxa filosa TaxID=46433 RepID=X6LVG0_RETFI|nr:hypothetical protein RFI_31514 [Reticulomyxa filosa]|eukprot:ETO05883.1 hypothetical protein RFI_31514 [Reticulomyxa filosa]